MDSWGFAVHPSSAADMAAASMPFPGPARHQLLPAPQAAPKPAQQRPQQQNQQRQRHRPGLQQRRQGGQQAALQRAPDSMPAQHTAGPRCSTALILKNGATESALALSVSHRIQCGQQAVCLQRAPPQQSGGHVRAPAAHRGQGAADGAEPGRQPPAGLPPAPGALISTPAAATRTAGGQPGFACQQSSARSSPPLKP